MKTAQARFRSRSFGRSAVLVALGAGVMAGATAWCKPPHDFRPVRFLAAEAKRLVNVDKEGLAIQGYDPVAYFTKNAAMKGDPEMTARHEGATYRFASAEHRELFLKDPSRYVPAFGGYCGYGVAKNALARIDPTAFEVVEGRLILQYNADAKAEFDRDLRGNLARADANWPGLVERQGK